MIYGHSPIYDWQDHSTKDLEKMLKLIGELEDLGLQCCSDEIYLSIQEEIKKRKSKRLIIEKRKLAV